jgi:secreted trypsin-like serine protease
MMRAICVGALTMTCIASCGGAPPAEDLGTTSSPIQGGTTDTTHQFVVGVVQLAQEQQNMVAFCTGVLLAPNLVATARHCVAMLGSTTIDCTTSTFGALFPASQVFVTTDTNITMKSPFISVTNVIVPSGADQTAVCGNDIALMILGKNIDLPEYVEPVINPPMTDPQYEHTVTAIGYGIDTPTDMTGMTAGTRRIKENVQLTCIPNDTTFSDCFTDPAARQVLTASEFVSGDSTCEGDSGSGAFEQGNFNQGKWLAFGVLSRGGVSTDGTTCEQPIYSRFDAWGSLVVDAAQQAAQQAAAQKATYPLAVWAGGSASQADAGPAVTFTDAGDCATGDCAEGASNMAASGSGGCDIAGGTKAPARGPRSAVALLGLVWAVAAGRRRQARGS